MCEADDAELAATLGTEAEAAEAKDDGLRLENAEWSDSTASMSTTDASSR